MVPSLLVIFEDLWKIGETVAALSCPDVHKEDGHGSPYPCVHFYIPLPPAENLGQMVHSDDFWVSQKRRKNSVSGVHVEKAVAPHSSTLSWKIPWMEEPGRLQSMGLRRVGHDWATSLSLFTFMHWRRKWQPTPVFLPEESQGQWCLVGCHLWGCTESDKTEAT